MFLTKKDFEDEFSEQISKTSTLCENGINIIEKILKIAGEKIVGSEQKKYEISLKAFTLITKIFLENFKNNNIPKNVISCSDSLNSLIIPEEEQKWPFTGFSLNFFIKPISSVFDSQVSKIFSMENKELGGVRLLIYENFLYYEVIDFSQKINLKIKLCELKIDSWMNVVITHDRRMYGE